jgi:hypothetical protein
MSANLIFENGFGKCLVEVLITGVDTCSILLPDDRS